jgi:hypothetical protein
MSDEFNRLDLSIRTESLLHPATSTVGGFEAHTPGQEYSNFGHGLGAAFHRL